MSHFIVQIKYKLLYKSYLLVPSLSAVWWWWGWGVTIVKYSYSL